jgi:hypothetical protein
MYCEECDINEEKEKSIDELMDDDDDSVDLDGDLDDQDEEDDNEEQAERRRLRDHYRAGKRS